MTEADLLGQPLKDDDSESIDNDKSESMSGGEEDVEGNKRRLDQDAESTKKKQKKEDGNDDSECETKAEKKLANMRRNIREVMDETQLDEATLSAQRQEMERLRRVQEQQRIIREVQRQIAINRQNNKTQTRVISLLQGKQNQGNTTISESTCTSSSSQVRVPSSVMLKVNASSGTGTQTSSGTQGGQMGRRPMDGMRWQKGRGGLSQSGSQTSISRVPNRGTPQNVLQQRIRMMTPSVSISPVVPKKEPLDRADYYSDSEFSDIEGDEALLHEKQMHTVRKTSGMPKPGKPAKGKDVVTISSSSESSDDDCIVLSDPSGGEETDNEDDPSNSGMHTNDRYNLPDEHGRVLINVGHPDTEPDVYLAPQVARIIKPHQIGGIRFLFDNIVESIERYKNSSGFGCILAHSMGLGKTLQVASFCDIFFRCTTAKTVLCIMPINTLQNWLAEFNMWLPYEDPALVNNESKNTINVNSVKTESMVDSKQDIKEEIGSQSDISNMSRPISTESAHRLGHEGMQHPHMINEANTYGHQPYENHGMMRHYGQDGMMNKSSMDPSSHVHTNYHSGITQNTMYGAPRQAYDPVKQEIQHHSMPGRSMAQETNYGMSNQPQTGAIYPGMEARQAAEASIYPDVTNRDNSGQIYPEMHGTSSAPMYSGYENPPTGQVYGNYPSSSIPAPPPLPPPLPHQQMEHEIKKEEIPPQSQNANLQPKSEHDVKKEETGSTTTMTKGETSDEKKPTEIIETPDSVDSPIGMTLRPRHFRLHILNDSHKTMAARARVVNDWQKNGGVLLIGYELYRQLSLKKPNKAKRKRNQPFKDTVDVEEEDKNKGLLDDMHSALVSPGPDLVICDEGHRIKNSHASISMALKQMKTKRRIVLTGYPLQNNLLEYWCMVDFVRPNYLGTKSEFCNMFERPIQNGQCIDSTPQDIRLMRYRAHVLHALLEGFVQRRSHSVLQISLPRKEEYILLVRMTPHQRKLYDVFMNQVVKTRAVPNPLKAFAVCCKIWNHPDILYHFLRKRQANEEDDLDLEEPIGEKPAPGGKRGKTRQPKGEPKKGKKVNATNLKNKPAASVPPTSSSSSSNDNVNEAENSHGNSNKPGQFSSNYPAQMNNSVYSNTPQQANYPQGYQNYRANEQNNYYRNDSNHGEYSEFYNNQQGQPRYGNPSQTFPASYSQQQAPGYNASQNYPNQQTYVGNNEASGNPRFTGPAPQSVDFRPETGPNGNNYETPGMFPRPYGFPEQGRGYPPNMNQPTNYPQSAGQQGNFSSNMSQQSPNVPINDYSAYGTSQSQNYSATSGEANNQMYGRPDNLQMQNPTLGYQAGNQQQNSSNTGQNQPSNYMTNQPQNPSAPSGNQNREFPTNQSNPGTMMAHGYPSTPQNAAMPMQNQQTHGYPNNSGATNPSAQNSTHGYTANQQQSSGTITPNNQSGGYIPNAPGPGAIPGQNPIRGYLANQQNQQNQNNPSTGPASYGPSQAASGTLSQQPPTQNTMHGYNGSHLRPPGPQPPNQTTGYSANSTNQSANQSGNYSANQQPSSQPQPHRYGSNQQAQTQQASMPQNQPMGYNNPSNPSTGMNPGEPMQNYSSTPGAPNHEFSIERQGRNPTPNPNSNYMPNSHSANQPQNQIGNYSADANNPNPSGQYNKNPDDPYWQRNYPQPGQQEQCSNQDQFFREPTSNRYSNNYYPGQNYANQGSYEAYPGAQNTEDTKNPPGNIMPRGQPQGPYDKSPKDSTPGVNVPNQTLSQNNPSTVTGYNGNDPQCTNMPRPQQPITSCQPGNPRIGQIDAIKEDDKEDVAEKEKEEKSDDEILAKDEEKDFKYSPGSKEDPGIPYDWVRKINLRLNTTQNP